MMAHRDEPISKNELKPRPRGDSFFSAVSIQSNSLSQSNNEPNQNLMSGSHGVPQDYIQVPMTMNMAERGMGVNMKPIILQGMN
jgi:hypothetical protein